MLLLTLSKGRNFYDNIKQLKVILKNIEELKKVMIG